MAVSPLEPAVRARPPRAIVWVLLLASAATVVVVGAVATLLVLGTVEPWPAPPAAFWWRLGAACVLTIASVSLRSLRWIFLLRRAETRIPIRDAYIGYLAGLSLLVAPLLLGEIAVRAFVHRARGGVPVATTGVVNVWERVIDVVAISSLAAVMLAAQGARPTWIWVALAVLVAGLIPLVRRAVIRTIVALVIPVARAFDGSRAETYDRLARGGACATALATSLVAWLLPAIGLWLIANSWGDRLGLAEAVRVYTTSVAAGALYLAPGGVLVAGPDMLVKLTSLGLIGGASALTVLGIRLATVGVSMILGAVFVALHFRSTRASSQAHFDDIADAYDVQIPEARRHALLERKTAMMTELLRQRGAGRRGLDVGCGQGTYVARMRALGFEVNGIDTSGRQVQLAVRNVGDASHVQVGSALEVPAADATYDFLYVINVLHHLSSEEEQRRAFAELFRVLAPGGILFVHEINTRNVLFRFYMGYVFPSLNCIDEGVERWLLPHDLGRYTDVTVAEVRYFTFLPDLTPQFVARALRPLERFLEASRFRVYSAHYMAVLIKPGGPDDGHAPCP